MLEVLNDVMRGLCVPALEGSGFMDALPDPMKLDAKQIVFVMGVVTLLYFVLRGMFFRPVLATIDARDQAIEGGAARRAEVAGLVTERQEAYEAQLKALRAQAFERRKALSEAAAQERQRLTTEARETAGSERATALEQLARQQAAAKEDLVAQVDQLADAMVAHLLKA